MYTRIKAPKFKIGRYSLNEYELRCLMLEVLEGKKSEGIKVKDEKGTTAIIEKDGRLSCNLYGLQISSNFTVATIKILRSRVS